MTPEEALRALLAARALLPPPAALGKRKVMATAFSASKTADGLLPELLLFHPEEGAFTPQLVARIADTGVRLRYMSNREMPEVRVSAEQRQFADEVLTRPGPLMAGARLLLDPAIGVKGTVGCIAVRDGTPGFITCAHVVDEAHDGRLCWPGAADVIGKAQDATTVREVGLVAAYGAGFPPQALCLDAAFVPIASLAAKPSRQVHGLGVAEPVVDVPFPDLLLIDERVYAVGAASGQRRGLIAGLLYEEYRTTFTATADYLIGSRDDTGHPMSLAGDSGSVWFLEKTRQPLALHFGRQLLSVGQRRHPVSLASNLSLALTELGATFGGPS